MQRVCSPTTETPDRMSASRSTLRAPSRHLVASAEPTSRHDCCDVCDLTGSTGAGAAGRLDRVERFGDRSCRRIGLAPRAGQTRRLRCVTVTTVDHTGIVADGDLDGLHLDEYDTKGGLWCPEHGDVELPNGWEFVAAGDNFVTRRVKVGGGLLDAVATSRPPPCPSTGTPPTSSPRSSPGLPADNQHSAFGVVQGAAPDAGTPTPTPTRPERTGETVAPSIERSGQGRGSSADRLRTGQYALLATP